MSTTIEPTANVAPNGASLAATPRSTTRTAAEGLAQGKALRDRVPRSSHSAWVAPPDRRDPLEIISETTRGRVAALVPMRNARMAESPFAFYRGTADVMAADLAGSPVSASSCAAMRIA
jgi:hypothetical protein